MKRSKWVEVVVHSIVVAIFVLFFSGAITVSRIVHEQNTLSSWQDWWDSLLQNFGTEMLGALLTYILIEVLIGRREKQRDAEFQKQLAHDTNTQMEHFIEQQQELNRQLLAEQEKQVLIGQLNSRVAGFPAEAARLLKLRFADAYTDDLLAAAIAGGADFAKAELEGINLSNREFVHACLEHAILTGANLHGIQLRSSRLEGCDLSESNLQNADLFETNLKNSTLYRANLANADLRGVKLTGANLRHSSLKKANLRGAELDGADLRGAMFFEADLSGAALMNAVMSFSNLERAQLRAANLARATLDNTILVKAHLREANLTEADLSKANLHNAILIGANLRNATLQESEVSQSDLNQSELSGANLNKANLSEASLYRATLHRASLVNAKLINSFLQDADFTGSNLENADITGSNLKGAVLDQVDLSDARGLSVEQLLTVGSLRNTTLPNGGTLNNDTIKQTSIQELAIYCEPRQRARSGKPD